MYIRKTADISSCDTHSSFSLTASSDAEISSTVAGTSGSFPSDFFFRRLNVLSEKKCRRRFVSSAAYGGRDGN
jgi:hypothetical protein